MSRKRAYSLELDRVGHRSPRVRSNSFSQSLKSLKQSCLVFPAILQAVVHLPLLHLGQEAPCLCLAIREPSAPPVTPTSRSRRPQYDD